MRKLKVPVSEVKYIGLEPTWNGRPSTTEMVNAYTWYRAVLDAKSARDVVEDYMHWKSFSQTDIDFMSYIDDAWYEGSNIPALCRMAMRGLVLNERQESLLNNVLPGMVQNGKERKAERDAARRPKPKPLQVATDLVGEAMCKIEYSFDRGELVDAAAILKMHSPKPADLAPEQDRFRRLIEEVQQALERTNIDAVECYRTMTKKQLRELLARYSGVLQAINLYCSSNIKAPTVRKVKPKTPEKLVAKLRYLPEYKVDDLEVKSINPKDIIGASEVILYNVKRRNVYRYVAPLGSKLSINRSSIDGYDPQLSTRKRLGKPTIHLTRLLSGGAKSIGKTYDAITTKPAEVNGRVNEDMIILRAVK